MKSIRTTLVSMSLAGFAAFGFAACAAPVDSDDANEGAMSAAEEEKVGSAEEALQNQCCIGYFTCPVTHVQYPWFTGPSALCNDGEHTFYGTASSKCDAACTAACTLTQQGCYWP